MGIVRCVAKMCPAIDQMSGDPDDSDWESDSTAGVASDEHVGGSSDVADSTDVDDVDTPIKR